MLLVPMYLEVWDFKATAASFKTLTTVCKGKPRALGKQFRGSTTCVLFDPGGLKHHFGMDYLKPKIGGGLAHAVPDSLSVSVWSQPPAWCR